MYIKCITKRKNEFGMTKYWEKEIQCRYCKSVFWVESEIKNISFSFVHCQWQQSYIDSYTHTQYTYILYTPYKSHNITLPQSENGKKNDETKNEKKDLHKKNTAYESNQYETSCYIIFDFFYIASLTKLIPSNEYNHVPLYNRHNTCFCLFVHG